jgi:hypothetical protein
MKSAIRMKKTITAAAAYCPMAIAPTMPRVMSACAVTVRFLSARITLRKIG